MKPKMENIVFRDDLTVAEIVGLFYAIKIPPKIMEELIHKYALNFAQEYYEQKREWINEETENWIE